MSKQNNNLILLKAIKKCEFPTGSTYLSQKLNIPPATIGRNLTQLEKDGLLEKVSNKGRIITDKGIRFLKEESVRISKLKSADKLINMTEEPSKEKLLEILEVRKLLEGRSVELACKNATDAENEELENIIFEHEYEIRRGGLGNVQDLDFHTKIAYMSKNATIFQILNLILAENNAYTFFSIVADHVKNTQLEQHNNIVQAIKRRDSVSAKIAMEEHLDQVISDIKNNYNYSTQEND
jgi:DNA-binding FadR family transcriptional regulator